jgi:hypothetical protein
LNKTHGTISSRVNPERSSLLYTEVMTKFFFPRNRSDDQVQIKYLVLWVNMQVVKIFGLVKNDIIETVIN